MEVKRYATKFSLLDELNKANERVKNPELITGVSSTTFSTMISAPRNSMYDKHVAQHMTLNHPVFPKTFTGTENLYGDLSYHYTKPKHDTMIVKIIKKFKTNHIASVFIKDLVTGEYDVIERADIKSLTEVFGFAYNNERLDALEENDIVSKGEIINHSTGYDEYNNYCMGVNALTLFSFHPNLTEDAAMIYSGFAKKTTFNKSHQLTIKIPLQNMIPLNIHGDADHYKIIPDIGEKCDDIVAALRHISITQIADLTNEELTNVNRLQDTIYVAHGELVDIDVYTNEPLPEGIVYDQLRDYLDQQRTYYKKVYDFCRSIKKEKRSITLMTLYNTASKFVAEDHIWIDKNIIKSVHINLTLREVVDLIPGQKITG